MAWKKGNPGCPRCDPCPCTLSANYDSWVETAGNWTIVTGSSFEATTADSDAELTCNATHDGWKIATAQIRMRALGEWSLFGFRDASGDDRIYFRWKVTKPAAVYVHTIEVIEVDDGAAPSTLTTITFNTGGSPTEYIRNFHIWHDPDNDVFDVWYPNASGTWSVSRSTTTVTVDRPFVATETISATVDFERSTVGTAETLVLFRKCLYHFGSLSHADRSPGEFEVEISGVTAGIGPWGSDYTYFNDVFVLPFSTSVILDTNGISYRYLYTHPNYGQIAFTLVARHVTGVGLRVLLQILLPAVDIVGGFNLLSQCVRFDYEAAGNCLFDWRTLGDDEYHGGQDGQVLDYRSSNCYTPISGTPCDGTDTGCVVGADFTDAIITIRPVP